MQKIIIAKKSGIGKDAETLWSANVDWPETIEEAIHIGSEDGIFFDATEHAKVRFRAGMASAMARKESPLLIGSPEFQAYATELAVTVFQSPTKQALTPREQAKRAGQTLIDKGGLSEKDAKTLAAIMARMSQAS